MNNKILKFDSDLVSEESFRCSLWSYLGVLKHSDSSQLEDEIIWLSGLAEIKIQC